VALILEVVGAELLAQADAAALVAPEVHDHATAGLLDQPHRQVQLLAAVATGRAQDVACQTLSAPSPGRPRRHRCHPAYISYRTMRTLLEMSMEPASMLDYYALTSSDKSLSL
jgi:hypothetical protein